MKNEIVDFLYESNLIESEPSGQALADSIKAWNYMKPKKILCFNHILSTHYSLMQNLNHRIAGKIRSVAVYIGGRTGANPASINHKLNELVKIVPKTWEEIKQWHVDFETIHPFEDGNGRTGRIIMNWQRIKNNLPIIVIHHGQEQMEYYDWFY